MCVYVVVPSLIYVARDGVATGQLRLVVAPSRVRLDHSAVGPVIQITVLNSSSSC
jgi:hypothetical protein